MNKKTGKKWVKIVINDVLYPLLALAIVVSIWAIVAAVKNRPLLLPMPGAVFSRLVYLFAENNFWFAVGSTLVRTITAFAISFIIGYALSLLAVRFVAFHRIFDTLVAILRAAPTVAVILIAYAFLPTRTMTVVVGILIALPILYSALLGRLSSVDKNLLKMARAYKAKKSSTLFHVYFLSVLPFTFDISKSTLSLTLKVVIAAEILTIVSKSVGGAIYNANATFEIDYLLAWTTLAILLSFLTELFVAGFKKLCVRWEDESGKY